MLPRRTSRSDVAFVSPRCPRPVWANPQPGGAAAATLLAQRWDKSAYDVAHEDDDPEIEEELESVDA